MCNRSDSSAAPPRLSGSSLGREGGESRGVMARQGGGQGTGVLGTAGGAGLADVLKSANPRKVKVLSQGHKASWWQSHRRDSEPLASRTVFLQCLHRLAWVAREGPLCLAQAASWRPKFAVAPSSLGTGWEAAEPSWACDLTREELSKRSTAPACRVSVGSVPGAESCNSSPQGRPQS